MGACGVSGEGGDTSQRKRDGRKPVWRGCRPDSRASPFLLLYSTCVRVRACEWKAERLDSPRSTRLVSPTLALSTLHARLPREHVCDVEGARCHLCSLAPAKGQQGQPQPALPYDPPTAPSHSHPLMHTHAHSPASTAARGTRPGLPSRTASTSASTAPRPTATQACTSPLSGPPTSTSGTGTNSAP